MYRNSSKKAFTLIELLVVIAIIAILAAILFPVFAKVREKARQTTCLSNEKQMGIAVMQYVQDFEEVYPLGQWHNATGGGLYDWTVAVQPYVKAGQINGAFSSVSAIWDCPSFPREPQFGHDEQGQYHGLEDIFMDYTANASSAPNPLPRPTAMNDVDHPADQVMVYEGGLQGPHGYTPSWAPAGQGLQAAAVTGDFCWIGWNNCDSTPTDPQGMVGSGTSILSDCDNFTNASWASLNEWGHVDGEMCGTFPRYRHNGICNMLFCDGHAKGMRKGQLNYNTEIWIPALHVGQAPWNPLI